MKKISVIFAVLVITASLDQSFGQSTSVPTSIVDAGVVLTKQNIDTIEADKATQKNNISQYQAAINDLNHQISQVNSQIDTENDNEQQLQQSLLTLASQETPLQSAVDICNSNASIYCPGWVVK